MLAHNMLYTYIAPFVASAGLGNEVDIVLLVFGLVAQVSYLDDRVAGRSRWTFHQPISIKNSAATASSTITIKIDCTTLDVVCSPTDSALPLTLKPSRQPTAAIRKAKNGALTMPTRKFLTLMSECNIEINMSG